MISYKFYLLGTQSLFVFFKKKKRLRIKVRKLLNS